MCYQQLCAFGKGLKMAVLTRAVVLREPAGSVGRSQQPFAQHCKEMPSSHKVSDYRIGYGPYGPL